MQLPLVVVLGPTATGKTALGLELALKLNGEIISGDSMQVYRYLDIGTAKIKPEEKKGVPHHLIDIIMPDDHFSVAEFKKLAEDKISEIAARHRLPIMVGGTGLYIQSVIDDYNFAPQANIAEYRKHLMLTAQEHGNEYLYSMLEKVDPQAAGKIHVNDLKRVTRALEYFHLTRQRISANKQGTAATGRYNAVLLGLYLNRPRLYERINRRVDSMMEEGFLEEVKSLLRRGYSSHLPALQGLGYKQLIAYLNGEYDLDTAVELIKRDTRRFAKRQLTWFRRDKRIRWFDIDNYKDFNELLFEIINVVGRTIQIGVE